MADQAKANDKADRARVKVICGLCKGTGKRGGTPPHGTCTFCEGRGWYWRKA